jgi:hypothetical protein
MKQARFLNDRTKRALLLCVALVLLATMVRPGPMPSPRGAAVATLSAQAVALDEEDVRRRQVGPLLFRRGWDLDSAESRFGGISAMHVESGQVIAISDAGILLHFALPVAGASNTLRVRPLTVSGEDKTDRDTEALLAHGRHVWIAFERQNSVLRFNRRDWRLESAAQPRVMRDWRGNSGPEGMVRLADGRFLIFSEGRNDDERFSDVVLFDGDPAEPGTPATALRYRRIPGFRVTDAALLPDGRVLVLNRRFSPFEGVAAKLALVETGDLRPGAILQGREVADLRSPLTVDNMEALSVEREGGRTIVRIASDDNFMALQRTLLLEFELTAQPSPGRRSASR